MTWPPLGAQGAFGAPRLPQLHVAVGHIDADGAPADSANVFFVNANAGLCQGLLHRLVVALADVEGSPGTSICAPPAARMTTRD